MEELIRYIAPDAMAEFAKYLKRVLADINTKVVDEQRHEYRVDAMRRQKDAIALCAKRAHTRVIKGMPLADSVAIACQEVPYPAPEVIAYRVKLLDKQRAAALRTRRNIRIISMRREGKSNAEIAKAFGVSVSTVAKVLLKGEN